MTNYQLPLVTVIIANYNHADRLVKAIQSVLNQDYPNKQISIVDDGSTDDSVQVVNEVLGQPNASGAVMGMINNTPISFFPLNKNYGRSVARNVAIKNAWERTHIFGNLDSDDEYLPGKISKSVAKILEDPQHIGAVYTDFITENTISDNIIHEFRPSFDQYALMQNCIVNNDSFITKLALEAVQFYDENMEVAEDWDLWLRVSSKFMILHIAEPLLKVTITSKGASQSVPPAIWQNNWMKINQKLQSGQYG